MVGQQESCSENEGTGHRILTIPRKDGRFRVWFYRRNWVLGEDVDIQEAGVTSDVWEFRDSREEACEARIDGVDDGDERGGLDDRQADEEEFGSRKTVCTHDP